MHSIELTLSDPESIVSIIPSPTGPSWLSPKNERVSDKQKELYTLSADVWRKKEAKYWVGVAYKCLLKEAHDNRTRDIVDGKARREDPYSEDIVRRGRELAQRSLILGKSIKNLSNELDVYKTSNSIDDNAIEQEVKAAMVRRIFDQVELRQNLLSNGGHLSREDTLLMREEISSGIGLLTEVYGVTDANKNLENK